MSNGTGKRTASQAGLDDNSGRKKRRGDDYFYDTGRSSGGKLDHQVKYGPGIGFSPDQRGQLHKHFGTKEVTTRYTQYNSDRMAYVKSAEGMGRGLTQQEAQVKRNKDPGPTSIDHIIASGTGQHALNRSTLEFIDAGKDLRKELKKDIDSRDTKVLAKGFAQQAAALGRMRGFGREIMREENKGEGYGKFVDISGQTQQEGFVTKRNQMAKDLSSAMEKGDVSSYKRYMKHTFDSTGNLRLGHASGNSRVSTGFDMPLDKSGNPTQRGERLLHTLDTYGFPDMAKDEKIGKRNASGIFTTNQLGSRLSSSRQVSNDTVDHSKRFR